jgi:hypothetical protein
MALAMKQNEAPGPLHIILLCRKAVMPYAQGRPYPIQQPRFAHLTLPIFIFVESTANGVKIQWANAATSYSKSAG